MGKYKCYILDDEPLAIKVIEQHLSKFQEFEICGSSTSPLAALPAIKSMKPDLLFLDIKMPDITGLDLIEILQSKPAIVLTTAFRDFAVEGFELNVMDYLVKPIPFKRFIKTIEKFLAQQPLEDTVESNSEDGLFVKADRKRVRVQFQDILYIEGVKDYVKIVLKNKTILTKISIGNFQRQLPNPMFIRVHKSYIVAKDKITAYTATDVELDRKEIPIGRMYKENFSQRMGN
ncbi:MAG: LytTR family DNA-binding domain-containing protein [Saprospiraceae bacterium]|nr:LytTR family DNA-binding domain-containing protein [Saprospiraceae bacterium]